MIMIKFLLCVSTWLPLNRVHSLNTLQPLIWIIRISVCKDFLSVPISGWWRRIWLPKTWAYQCHQHQITGMLGMSDNPVIITPEKVSQLKNQKLPFQFQCFAMLKIKSMYPPCIVYSRGLYSPHDPVTFGGCILHPRMLGGRFVQPLNKLFGGWVFLSFFHGLTDE